MKIFKKIFGSSNSRKIKKMNRVVKIINELEKPLQSLSNGQLKSRGAVRNGKGEGEWVGYHDNGQLFFIGFLKNGKKEGHWNFYDKDGTENLAGHLWFHQGTGLYRDDGKVSD